MMTSRCYLEIGQLCQIKSSQLNNANQSPSNMYNRARIYINSTKHLLYRKEEYIPQHINN